MVMFESKLVQNLVGKIFIFIHLVVILSCGNSSKNEINGTWFRVTNDGIVDVLTFNDSLFYKDLSVEPSTYEIINDTLNFDGRRYNYFRNGDYLNLIRKGDTISYHLISKPDSNEPINVGGLGSIRGKYYLKSANHIGGLNIDILNDSSLHIVLNGTAISNSRIVGKNYPYILGSGYQIFLLTKDSIIGVNKGYKHFQISDSPIIDKYSNNTYQEYQEVDLKGNPCGWNVLWDEKGRRIRQSFSIDGKQELTTMEWDEKKRIVTLANYQNGLDHGYSISWRYNQSGTDEDVDVFVVEFDKGTKNGVDYTFSKDMHHRGQNKNGVQADEYIDITSRGNAQLTNSKTGVAQRGFKKFETFQSFYLNLGTFNLWLNYPFTDDVGDTLLLADQNFIRGGFRDSKNDEYVHISTDAFGYVFGIKYTCFTNGLLDFTKLTYGADGHFRDNIGFDYYFNGKKQLVSEYGSPEDGEYRFYERIN